MKRRTFLAGIAAAVASVIVPGQRPDRTRLFFSPAGLPANAPALTHITITGHDAQGRLVTEEIAIPEDYAGEVKSTGAFRDYSFTVTMPAREQKNVPVSIGWWA